MKNIPESFRAGQKVCVDIVRPNGIVSIYGIVEDFNDLLRVGKVWSYNTDTIARSPAVFNLNASSIECIEMLDQWPPC